MSITKFKIVIPARYESSRLPGKVLLDIAGKPMLQHVWQRAQETAADSVVIATDHPEVAEAATGFGADVSLTSESCQSGTDRVAEVCAIRNWSSDTVVVNVQGDAPLIPPVSINNVATLLANDPDASIATACTAIESEEDYLDPNVVKLVMNAAGEALYFSRAPIPAGGHNQSGSSAWEGSWRHLGLYAYRVSALRTLSTTPPCDLEQTERLEQLRALWLGMKIRVSIDEGTHGPDVDTENDLQRVEEILRGGAT